MGRLSTHVLDIVTGKAARDVVIELYRLDQTGGRTQIGTARTNADGRTDVPLMAGDTYRTGTYELVFHIGDYFRGGASASTPMFLDIVPLRVTLSEAGGHYHVPLLCSPFAYSTYRGS